MEFLIEATHLPGWSTETLLDRAADEVFRDDEARLLVSQNLGRGYAAAWRADVEDADSALRSITRAHIFFSRAQDERKGTPANPEFPGWVHHRFYAGSQLVYECAVPARRDGL